MIDVQKTADELISIINASGLVTEDSSVAILRGTDYKATITDDEDNEVDNPVTPEQYLAQKIASGYIKKAAKRGFQIIANEQIPL